MTGEAQIWVVGDCSAGEPNPATLGLLALARDLAPRVRVFVWGPAGSGAACVRTLGVLGAHVVSEVAVGESELAGPRVAAAVASASMVAAPEAILFGADADGREVAARLSARLDRSVVANVVRLDRHGGGLVATHGALEGGLVATSMLKGDPPGLYVLAPGTGPAGPSRNCAADLEVITAEPPGRTGGARIVASEAAADPWPPLEEAKVVVAGGRGVGSKAGYGMVEDLATILGGSPGASRGVVDEGWAPYGRQIGLSGKTVRPKVYIALGISGASQHLVGMEGSGWIVAVNNDPQAPIMGLADLGIVGDAGRVAGAIAQAVRAAKNGGVK